MTQKRIDIGVEEAKTGYDRFVSAWNNAGANSSDVEVHLNFEDLETLVSVLTPKRLELLRTLRKEGPISVRALSKILARDYKNVHVDASELEAVDLIQRTDEDLIVAPWDVINAQFRLVA